MYLGISARYKDRRVDRVVKDLGYSEYEVFYSPVVVSVTYILMFLSAGGCLLPMVFSMKWHLIMFVPVAIYGCVYYAVTAYSHNSFALTNGELVVVNPNFPFRKQSAFCLPAITKVYIGSNAPVWRKFLFLFINNYVDIWTENGVARFYCRGLEADAFDENLTEKTIEDLGNALSKKNIAVEISKSILE